MQRGIERMRLFALEHSRRAYHADFALYGSAVLALAGAVVASAAPAQWASTAALTLAGVVGWSVIEYALHRFVLHGLQPFRGWHEAHHDRPTALICAPTILSAALITTLVFLPACLLGDLAQACAVTLGVVAGYLAYAVTHHATHHWRTGNPWLQRRKRWHALHHHDKTTPRCYGVTSAFWDHVFRSALIRAPRQG
jgi:sterol desaturase/sphingolipid hydroxylase (fatty acid hydroxylase superfamily)